MVVPDKNVRDRVSILFVLNSFANKGIWNFKFKFREGTPTSREISQFFFFWGGEPRPRRGEL